MKKFTAAILAVLYMGTSTGATLHMHYCMGKLADWGIGHSNSKTCSKCGMEKSSEKDNGCCRDELKFIKNDTDQKTAQAGVQLIQLFAAAMPVSFVEVHTIDSPSVTEETPVSHAPPRSSGVAVHVRNCVFLI